MTSSLVPFSPPGQEGGSGGGGVAFPQQGQIDWVDFGKSAYTATFAILQRLAKARIQPITHGAGLALAAQFSLGTLGQQRINEALNNLRRVPAFDNVLYFGFGYESFVDLLSCSQVGINCITLCSVLSEVHSDEMAAWTLDMLWQTLQFPEDYKPSHTQFLALIKACSGVLAGSTFSQTAEMMLGGGRLKQHGRVRNRWNKAANADSLAEVLVGLFKISKHEIESIIVVGGWECAFIAALSEWLFNFTTYVDDEEGLIFTSAIDSDCIQVRIHYSANENPEQAAGLRLSNATYILRSTDDVWHHDEGEMMRHLSFRVPWEGCLSRVFGQSAVQTLFATSPYLGEFLGCSARIFSALANGEMDVSGFSRADYIDYVEASYGKGYVASAGRVFPELGEVEGLYESMSECLRKSVDGAVRMVRNTIHALKRLCGCLICQQTMEAPSGRIDIGMEGTSCLVGLTLTIQHLVRTMASVQQEAPLQPMALGIEHCYETETTRWWRCNGRVKSPNMVSDILHLVAEEQESTPKERSTENKLSQLLSEVAEIFIGPRYYVSKSNSTYCSSAISQSGVCIYTGSLRSIQSPYESLRLFHVLPGHIERNAQTYDELQDPTVSSRDILGEAIEFEVSTQQPHTRHTRPERPHIKALLTENSTGGGIFCYGVSSRKDAPIKAWVRPLLFSWLTLTSMGQIVCDGKSCSKGDLVIPCHFIQKGWYTDNSYLGYGSSIACCIWPQQHVTSKYWIIDRYNRGPSGSSTGSLIQRDDECLACSVQAAHRIGNRLASRSVLGQRPGLLYLMHIL